MAVKFSWAFTLRDDEQYNAVVTEVADVVRGKYHLKEVKFELFTSIALLKGEGTSLGKRVKCTLWLNDEGALTMKAKNMIEVLATAKGLDIKAPSFEIEQLEGALCKVMVDNDEKGYSNVDCTRVYDIKPEGKGIYQQYLEYKAKNEKNTQNAVTGSSKPVAPAPTPKEEFNPNPAPVNKMPINETTDNNNPFKANVPANQFGGANSDPESAFK